MKKVVILIVVFFISLIATGCRRVDLTVFIPNEYWSSDVIRAFEREYGVRVAMRTFDSNERALELIQGGSVFDIVVPSDYAIEELAAGNYILPIDWSQIDFPRTGMWANQLASYMELFNEAGFEILTYGVPYFWGTVGIIYNHTIPGMRERVRREGFGIIGAADLRTVVYDSSRCSMMAALLRDPNNPIRLHEATLTQINEAGAWLNGVLRQPTTSRISDQILDIMPSNTSFDAVIAYSGDATWITYSNSDYSFYNPDQTNVWIDAFTIMNHSSVNVELAYKFISFMLQYDNAQASTDAIFYTSMREDVLQNMVAYLIEEGKERSLAAYVPVTTNPQFFRFDNQVRTWVADAWAHAIAV